MKPLKAVLCVGILLSACTLLAQEDSRRHIPQPEHIPSAHVREDNRHHSLALQWGIYIPSKGGFLNHATAVAPSLEWDWRISNAFSVGASAGYIRGSEQGFTQDRYEGDLVTGASDRKLVLVPLTVHLRWVPVMFLEHRLRPFIGAATGVQYAIFRIKGDLINESKSKSWGAVVRPEAGISFYPRENGRICIEAKCGWQYASNEFPIMSVESLQGIQISTGVRYWF